MSDEFVKELQESARFADSRGYGGLCEKLIKAADAIEELNRKAIEWQEEACKWNNEYYHLLDNKASWISVNERLPEPRFAREWYLVSLESGCVMTLSFERDEKRWATTGTHVTHWMPLPEPPKESDNERC